MESEEQAPRRVGAEDAAEQLFRRPRLLRTRRPEQLAQLGPTVIARRGQLPDGPAPQRLGLQHDVRRERRAHAARVARLKGGEQPARVAAAVQGAVEPEPEQALVRAERREEGQYSAAAERVA